MRTARAFISGIQNAIDNGEEQRQQNEAAATNKGLSQELVTEVDDVLSKLMSAIQNNGDPKLAPLISSLQAALKGTVDKKEEAAPIRGRVEEEEESHAASKIPWKIRAARKRQMKHQLILV